MDEKHTPGTLVIKGISQDNGEISIGPKDQRFVVAYVKNAASLGDFIDAAIKNGSFGDPNDAHTQMANARRLVACWNACIGLSTEELEKVGVSSKNFSARKVIPMLQERSSLQTRISELEGLLSRIMKGTPHSMCSDAEAWAMAESALSQVGQNRGNVE